MKYTWATLVLFAELRQDVIILFIIAAVVVGIIKGIAEGPPKGW